VSAGVAVTQDWSGFQV